MEDWKAANPGQPSGEGGTAMLRRMNESHRPLREWAFPFLPWKPGMRILDAGCGGGAAIADMLERSPGSIIDGIDYSPESVALAKEWNRAQLGQRVFVREGNVSALPYDNGSFDFVSAIETVYFWPEPERAFAEIWRILKPNGIVAVLCEADGPERIDWKEVNFAMTVYRPAELEAFLHKTGFHNVSHQADGKGYLLVTGEK